MGDGISILTNLSNVGSVSRVQQGQQTPAHTNEHVAKSVRSNDEESKLLKNVEETEDSKVSRRRKEKRREDAEARRHASEDDEDETRDEDDEDARGRRVDVKV